MREVELDDIQKPSPFEEAWIWADEDYDESKARRILHGNIALIDVGIQPCDPPRNVLEWFEFWPDGKEDYFEGFEYNLDKPHI